MMKSRKMKIILSLMVFTLVFMAGCSDETKDNNEGNKELTGWAYIEDKGELIVGLDDAFAPMGFRDESGELVGLDIDLARAVSEELGVKVKFKPIVWDTKEMELMSKNIDCIWNGMSATEERQEKMALSKKYLNNRIVILTKDDSVKVANADDLKNYKIGTQVDSAALETMMNSDKYDVFKDNISQYKTYDEALMDMKTGRLDCMVVDEVLGEYKNSKLDKKFPVAEFDFGDDFYAIGCRKGETDVADKLNDALAKLIEQGKAQEISNNWFGKNIIILEDY